MSHAGDEDLSFLWEISPWSRTPTYASRACASVGGRSRRPHLRGPRFGCALDLR